LLNGSFYKTLFKIYILSLLAKYRLNIVDYSKYRKSKRKLIRIKLLSLKPGRANHDTMKKQIMIQ